MADELASRHPQVGQDLHTLLEVQAFAGLVSHQFLGRGLQISWLEVGECAWDEGLRHHQEAGDAPSAALPELLFISFSADTKSARLSANRISRPVLRAQVENSDDAEHLTGYALTAVSAVQPRLV
jgi:hypothetical protein